MECENVPIVVEAAPSNEELGGCTEDQHEESIVLTHAKQGGDSTNSTSRAKSARRSCSRCCCFVRLLLLPVLVLIICGIAWACGLRAATAQAHKHIDSYVANQLIEASNDSFGTPCRAGIVECGMVGGSITVFDYVIGNPPDYDGDFLSVQRVMLDLNLQTLFPDDRANIEAFIMEGVEGRIIVKSVLHDESNIKVIYDRLWTMPWHFKHLNLTVDLLEMHNVNITIVGPSLVSTLAPSTTIYIDRIIVTDIGKGDPNGGVSISEFLKIWADALWQAILTHAPGAATSMLLQAVNLKLGGHYHIGQVMVDVGKGLKSMLSD